MNKNLQVDASKASSRKIANALNWAGVRLQELTAEEKEQVFALADELGRRAEAKVRARARA